MNKKIFLSLMLIINAHSSKIFAQDMLENICENLLNQLRDSSTPKYYSSVPLELSTAYAHLKCSEKYPNLEKKQIPEKSLGCSLIKGPYAQETI